MGCGHDFDLIFIRDSPTMEDLSHTGPSGLYVACPFTPRAKGEESGEEIQSCRPGILLPHDYN